MSRRPFTLGALVDEIVLSATIVAEVKRSFSQTPPGPPPGHEALLDEVRAAPPRIHWPTARKPGRTRVRVDLPAMGQRTFFDLFRAKTERPDTLVVYHHGLGEIPHDIVMRTMRAGSRALRSRCDVVCVKGLHHKSWPTVNGKLVADRNVLVRSLVASASLVRAIAKDRRADYEHLIMCGISMGGVITLIESSREPRFDLYVPLLAGPNLPDVLLHSGFSRTVQSRWLKRERKAGWNSTLDMTDRLSTCEGPPILPLLARSDRLFRVGEQQKSYARVPRANVTLCDGGHITAAVRVDVLGRHLLGAIGAHRWSPAPAPRELARIYA